MSGVCACPMLPCGLWAHVSLGESQDSLIVRSNELLNLECRLMGNGTWAGKQFLQVCRLQIFVYGPGNHFKMFIYMCLLHW